MKTSQIHVLTLVAAIALLGGGCSKSETTPSPRPADAPAVEKAVENLQKGEVIQAIQANAQNASPPEAAAPKPQDPPTTSNPPTPVPVPPPVASSTPDLPKAPTFSDPCPLATIADPQTSAEDFSASVLELVSCWEDLKTPALAWGLAMQYYQKNTLPRVAPKQISQMTDEELITVVLSSGPPQSVLQSTLSPAQQSQIRSQFDNDELEELLRIVQKKREALLSLEEKISQTLALRPEFLSRLRSLDRYAALDSYLSNRSDTNGLVTAKKLVQVVRAKMAIPAQIDTFPNQLLHPYGLLALLPDTKSAFSPLNPKSENPFLSVLEAHGLLARDSTEVNSIVQHYREVRDNDNPPLPVHSGASPNAARVVILDTGLDYLRYPDLGLFLDASSDLSAGLSFDFADLDESPWLPAEGIAGHGTGTTATVLTVLARTVPDLLKTRQITLGFWKVQATQSLLSGGPRYDNSTWNSRPLAHLDGIIERAELAKSDPNSVPNILSISMGFESYKTLLKAGKKELIKNAPWLWVMSAGNESTKVEDLKTECFSDFPAELRPADQIICVGALSPGILHDQIAPYSNRGKMVDLYAYESYSGLCPDGTSCSTPAITAAAAAIKAKYPDLMAADIKSVLLSASDKREVLKTPNDTLSFFGTGLSSPNTDPSQSVVGTEVKETVQVFDPATMMEKALRFAEARSAKNTALP